MINAGSSRAGLSIREIQQAVALAFNLSVREMVSPCRRREVTRARHVAMYLSRKLAASPGGTPWTAGTVRSVPSFPRIGMAFSRDHSSVIHACTGIGRRLRDDASLVLLLDRLASELSAWPAAPLIAREGL